MKSLLTSTTLTFLTATCLSVNLNNQAQAYQAESINDLQQTAETIYYPDLDLQENQLEENMPESLFFPML